MKLICGDCVEVMDSMKTDCVDLVFGSPPYEDRRTYGIDFALSGQAWVDWMFAVTEAASRVCRGLIAWVVAGKTEKYRWSATPSLLEADLHRAGFTLRNPPIYARYGIPGSGGPDFLRGDHERIVCVTRGGKLPWSDPTAMGKPPSYGPGGLMSNRHPDGQRHNRSHRTYQKPSTEDRKRFGSHRAERQNGKQYKPPSISNPGNVIWCGAVGGGNMGDDLAHENEAPFPEYLAEFFVRTFCPPDGTVLDPFCGSGTTLKMALQAERNAIGIDIRESQIELSKRRCREIQRQLI